MQKAEVEEDPPELLQAQAKLDHLQAPSVNECLQTSNGTLCGELRAVESPTQPSSQFTCPLF